MRLFDRYLLACTNQRIPMPAAWQASLGLALGTTRQDSVKEGIAAENTGYNFQRDDTINRGFVNHRSKTKTKTITDDYIFQLYLQALKYHKGEDYCSYFLPSHSRRVYEDELIEKYGFSNYVTEAPIIWGEMYSIYGLTMLPVSIEIYSTASNTVIYETTIPSLSLMKQFVIDTKTLEFPKPTQDEPVVEDDVEQEQEYFMIKVVANVAVAIVQGDYNRLPLSKFVPALNLPSARKVGDDYFWFIGEENTNIKVEGMPEGDKSVGGADTPVEGSKGLLGSVEDSTQREATETKEVEEVSAEGDASTSTIFTNQPFVQWGSYGVGNAAKEGYYWFIEETDKEINKVVFTNTGILADGYQGKINSYTAEVAISDAKATAAPFYPVKLPSVGYMATPYADKLIPALLGINITKNSPPALSDLLPVILPGDSPQEKILINTSGLYDVDEYLGRRFQW